MPDTIILTPALRDEMRDALEQGIELGNHGDHAGYLDVLNATPDGTDLAGHDLEDVIHYFGIEA